MWLLTRQKLPPANHRYDDDDVLRRDHHSSLTLERGSGHAPNRERWTARLGREFAESPERTTRRASKNLGIVTRLRDGHRQRAIPGGTYGARMETYRSDRCYARTQGGLDDLSDPGQFPNR